MAPLRLSPRSFARYIGESLNAAEDSSWVIASSSRAHDQDTKADRHPAAPVPAGLDATQSS